MTRPDSKALLKARELLGRGELDRAVRELVEAGAPDEAARALAGANRFVEAADVLLHSLGVAVNRISTLRDPKRVARASHAADLLRRGGVRSGAAEIEAQLASAPRPEPAEIATVRARRGGPPPEDEKTEIERTGPPQLLQTFPTARPAGRVSTGGAEAAPQGLMDEPFQEGARIDDRYQLGPLIGRGGMARVFAATDCELEQRVAVKVFDRMDDATLLARFKQELLSTRQIAHPNVVRVFDIGTFREHKYLTMELLVGRDLKERLKAPIAVSESLDLLAQACRGLGAAHAVGVIHRDIKPQNLFLCENHLLKLMDFGVAKLQASARLTEPGSGVGTPEFMAPEQIADSSRVSPATDLYAIGVTAYRMCTGRVPFADKDLITLLKRQIREPPRPMRELNPRLPPQLDALVLALLAKDPAARPKDANQVAESFASLRKLFAPA